MTKKKNLLGILVMALVLGMTVVGCDDGSTEDLKTDSALNGTWSYRWYSSGYSAGPDGSGEEEREDHELILKLNNGSMETSEDGITYSKGTYTTNDGKLTRSLTHIHGILYEGSSYGLESKWYSKSELETALKHSQVPDEDITIIITGTFEEVTYNYSVSGNTLTLSFGGESVTYTKK